MMDIDAGLSGFNADCGVVEVHVSRRDVRKFLCAGWASGHGQVELGRGRIDSLKKLRRVVQASGTRW